MSYSEQDGQVVLTMSREDYDQLLLSIGALMILRMQYKDEIGKLFELVNRLNQGNPNFTPYKVEK